MPTYDSDAKRVFGELDRERDSLVRDIRDRRNKQRNASANAPTACPWPYCTCKVTPSTDVDVLFQVIDEQDRLMRITSA